MSSIIKVQKSKEVNFMSVRTYSKEEKQAYLEDYKNSGESLSRYALENDIPKTTLRGWMKEDRDLTFGAIEIKSSSTPLPRVAKSATVFATENIRIELKENFDKELLKKIVGVLIND
jgi:transposase-like protein